MHAKVFKVTGGLEGACSGVCGTIHYVGDAKFLQKGQIEGRGLSSDKHTICDRSCLRLKSCQLLAALLSLAILVSYIAGTRQIQLEGGNSNGRGGSVGNGGWEFES